MCRRKRTTSLHAPDSTVPGADATLISSSVQSDLECVSCWTGEVAEDWLGENFPASVKEIS